MNKKIIYFKYIICVAIGINIAFVDSYQIIFKDNLFYAEKNAEAANEPSLKSKIETIGIYKGNKWHIDERHILWWDNKPYIPFTTNQIWIDRDKFSESEFIKHYNMLDKLTNDLTKKGETYFVLFLTHPHIKTLADLFDPTVKARFEKEWKRYAPAVAKEGLRAMTFINEINSISASEKYSSQDYQNILNEYAKKLKETVGNVPVLLKIVGSWNIDRFLVAIQGDYIDGLGGDFFTTYPDESLMRMMTRPIHLLKQSRKTKLFWITEFSRIAGKEPQHYWPAFDSKEQMKSFMEIYVSQGATGFFYFDIHQSGIVQVNRETEKWFRELKPEFKKKILAP